MRIRSLAAVAVAMGVAGPAAADSTPFYIEKFVGWSKDHAYYEILQSGTDEVDRPTLCVSERGAHPASWPKEVPLPADDDERGCTDTLDTKFPDLDPPALVKKAAAWVVPPLGKAPHGETVSLKKVSGGGKAQVTVSRGKPIGKAFIELRNADSPLPPIVAAWWRDDGQVVAVEASYAPAPDSPGYGPPAYVALIALDGSSANAAPPKSPREQASALNVAGMKLLTADKRDEAQAQFVAAAAADPTYVLAHYNLASVASLRKDSNTAVAALLKVVDLAHTDAQAKQALAHGKTDHDLDFIASQSPYVTQLLGRPRTKGDDWCIAAEKRARDVNPGNFIGVAEEAAPLIDPAATHGGLPATKDPEFTCFVQGDQSQLTITMWAAISGKDKREKVVRVAWEIFPSGMFDADAFPDEAAPTKTVRLQKLAHVAQVSKLIAGAK